MNVLRWRHFDTLAQHRKAAILTCALVSLLVSASFTAIRVPAPRVHDEFSYLLAADTFANGKLANQPHPLWEHFESFHVIQQPSYASKYQPGQGMILAAGIVLGGHPIFGAWLATALAAAAVCWMLQGWLPCRWALLGGLLVALHGMIQVRWSLSYWGGGLPMAGGALMFGALPRIMRQPQVSSSALLALGAVLLAATRPFEGFLVGICVAVALLDWMLSDRRPEWLTVVSRVVLPAAGVLWIGIAALGFYNLNVTGDALKMPYQVHEASYGYSPLFLWQSPEAQPVYRHQVMHDFQTGWAIEDYQQQETLSGWLMAKIEGYRHLWLFFLGSALFLPLVMLRPLLRRRQLYVAWIALLLFLVAESAVPWTYPHYYAPVAPLLFLFVVQGMRYLAVLPRHGHTWAGMAVPAVVLFQCVTLVLLFVKYAAWQPEGWEWNRARIVQQLENTDGKHLVLVHYTADHNGHAEWVYNDADIENAKVVWARPMGSKRDEVLLRYFDSRSIWTINADAEHPVLTPLKPTNANDVLSSVIHKARP